MQYHKVTFKNGTCLFILLLFIFHFSFYFFHSPLVHAAPAGGFDMQFSRPDRLKKNYRASVLYNAGDQSLNIVRMTISYDPAFLAIQSCTVHNSYKGVFSQPACLDDGAGTLKILMQASGLLTESTQELELVTLTFHAKKSSGRTTLNVLPVQFVVKAPGSLESIGIVPPQQNFHLTMAKSGKLSAKTVVGKPAEPIGQVSWFQSVGDFFAGIRDFFLRPFTGGENEEL